MVKTEKCNCCRDAKQKCLPEDRIWVPNLQQRCANCIKGNRPCGPNEKPPNRPPRRRTIQPKQLQCDSAPEQEEQSSHVEEGVNSGLSSNGIARSFKSDIAKELRNMLKELDAEAEVAKQVQAETETIEKGVLSTNIFNIGVAFYELAALRHATAQRLLSKLNVVEALADRADAAGDTDLTDIAYTRILDIYRGYPFPVGSLTRPLLKKMAMFYLRTDQPLRAEKCWASIFEIRDFPGQAPSTEREVWQRLSESLSKTSEIISDVIQSRYAEPSSSLNIETPFPPLHRIINLLRPGFLANIINIHCSVTDGEGSLGEIIQGIPDKDIATRDLLLRSPLWLAAFLKQEDLGYVLLKRIAGSSPAQQHQHMNARDVSGQTVLGIAILSDCSLKFVEALIDHGAEIDPDSLLKEPLTPLQAACMTGSQEIVDLLLERGANINRVFLNNPTPAELARVVGHDRIAQAIDQKSQSSFPLDESQHTQHSFTEESDINFRLSSPTDETINTSFESDIQNSPQGFSYPLPPR